MDLYTKMDGSRWSHPQFFWGNIRIIMWALLEKNKIILCKRWKIRIRILRCSQWTLHPGNLSFRMLLCYTCVFNDTSYVVIVDWVCSSCLRLNHKNWSNTMKSWMTDNVETYGKSKTAKTCLLYMKHILITQNRILYLQDCIYIPTPATPGKTYFSSVGSQERWLVSDSTHSARQATR